MAISFVGAGALAAATTTPLTPTLPPHSAGDFLAVFIQNRNGGDITAPPGWTRLADMKYDSTAQHSAIFYKVAGSSESNPSISLSVTPSNGWAIAAGAWSGVDSDDPIDSGFLYSNTGVTGALTSTPFRVRTHAAGSTAVVFAGTTDNNNLALAAGSEQGFTARMSGASYATGQGADMSIFVGDRIVASPEVVAAPTIEQTQLGADAWQFNGMFALKPEGASIVGVRPIYVGYMRSAATSPVAVPVPDVIEAADLIVVPAVSRTNTSVFSATGFTSLALEADSFHTAGVLYKVADGSETTVSVAATDPGNGYGAWVEIYRGQDATPWDAAATTSDTSGSTSATFTPPSITTVTADALVVARGFLDDDVATSITTAQSFTTFQNGLQWRFDFTGDAVAIAGQRQVATVGSVTAPTFTAGVARRWVGITSALRPAAAATPPDAPPNPAAAALSASSIRVTWDDVADETGFRVERSDDGTTGWADVSGNLAADTTSWDDTGLTASTQYFYRVFAFNAGGDSDPSSTVNATTAAAGGGGNRMGGTGAIRKPPRY